MFKKMQRKAKKYKCTKIKNIKHIGKEDVYNMQVENHHNYSVNGGFIIHNCDAVRYYVKTVVKPRRLAR
ncbi:hypothetical protein [Andreesenia angusta]|uniref:hypothetical protein n=1 Tax=Andreesenia angusta TaxID=39480 RepID=UPI000A03FB6A